MSLYRWAMALAFLLLVSGSLYAQQATIVGTAADESSAVLPGVTITATDLANGRQFVAVTAERGDYRMPGVPSGRYKMQAELAGFATVVLSEVELLVGQNATVDFTLKVATLAETVTVQGEAPLIDTQRAQVGGNVDRRQMEQLPIQGRNWMELSMMVKGVTANSVSERPGVVTDADFQLNLDGQQITQNLCCSSSFGQPKLSREAIAEYQIVTNLFDVSMGRSQGLQVQAVTRAGTNNVNGSYYGYFRDDKFNRPDFVAKKVLPYSDQQTGATLGGPIIKDRLQYFASYEYERNPNTWFVAPAVLQGQSLSVPTKTMTHTFLGRFDYQFGPNDHLMVRGTAFRRFNPSDQLSGTTYPTYGSSVETDSKMVTGNWSRVISSNLLQEVRIGYYRYHWLYAPMAGVPLTPEYVFPGLTIGPRWNYPEEYAPTVNPSLRYDLTWHIGTHDVKIGGEFLRGSDWGWWPTRSRGQFFFSATPADMARRFPLGAWNDASQWDLSGLDALVLRFDQYVASDWNINVPRPTWAAWIGDTWAVNDDLTLNLGVRYDLSWGDTSPPGVTENDLIINNGLFTENIGYRNDIRDLRMVAPRVGFNWKASGVKDLVIRGGSGLFYGNTSSTQALEQQLFSRIITNSYVNDGKPGFLLDPRRGATIADVLAGRVPLLPQNPAPIAHDFRFPHTWQSILGFQKQVGEVMGLDADLVYQKGYNLDNSRDPNLFYDPVTGFPKNPRNFGRPNPIYGSINLRESHGRSDYMALASSLTRRYRNNFQAGLTYTLMFFKHDTGTGSSGYGGVPNNPFNVNADWARSADFQRHTLRANLIYQLPWHVQLASSFFLGSGNYFDPRSPVDPFGTGSTRRVLADLTVLPRNSFKGQPLQKLDLRLSKDVSLGSKVKLTGLVEGFNLFNHPNYGSYQMLWTSPLYGQPTQNLSTAYLPRVVQLGFKVAF